MQNLKLTRPLAVFDLETTGIDVEKDRVIQIAVIRVEPDGSRRTYETLVNPERPIPPEATKVHGIKDADVADKPTFSQIRLELEEYLAGADLAGYNSIRFDTPLLQNELRWAGIGDIMVEKGIVPESKIRMLEDKAEKASEN